MDKGAWQARVHGVAKSQKQLSDYHSHSPICGHLRLFPIYYNNKKCFNKLLCMYFHTAGGISLKYIKLNSFEK